MINKVWLFALLVAFSACGYKPTSIYSKKVLGSAIYVKVDTSLEDPENSVLIRDAINEAVIYKLNAKVVKEQDASAKLLIKLAHVDFQPIEYDTNGYVVGYKTNVTLLTTYHDKYAKQKSFKTYGDYDFNIASNSVISDNKRFNAIKEASQKAIDAFISRLSVEGVNDDHQ
jgi:hypothetical protein